MKKILLSFLFIMISIANFAWDVQVDGIYYNLYTVGRTAEVAPGAVGYYEGDVAIPETITVGDVIYTVTGIAEKSFSECDGLTSVLLPSTITSIGVGAFYQCHNVKSINIPDGVTRIESHCFAYCWELESVNIPEAVTFIGDNAFINTSILRVDIPDNVTVMGSNVFAYCPMLNTVTIGDGLTVISSGTFTRCPRLRSLQIGKNVETISQLAFYCCEGLKTLIIPDNVKTIGEAAFYLCIGLTEVNIPDNVKILEHHAFQYCSNVQNINIGDGVEMIGNVCFSDAQCKTLRIGKSVEYIGEQAFVGNIELTDVFCHAETVPTAMECFYYIPVENATLHVPAPSIDDYRNHDLWGQFGSIVPLNDAELGIDNVNGNAGENSVYDLSGRRLQTMQKGINIVGGKKVLMK